MSASTPVRDQTFTHRWDLEPSDEQRVGNPTCDAPWSITPRREERDQQRLVFRMEVAAIGQDGRAEFGFLKRGQMRRKVY